MTASIPCPLRLLNLPRLSALFFALVLTTASAAVAQPIPVGKSQLTVTLNDTPIQVYTYRPTNYAGGPLFVVFHGMLRNADAYRDSAVVLGEL